MFIKDLLSPKGFKKKDKIFVKQPRKIAKEKLEFNIKKRNRIKSED